MSAFYFVRDLAKLDVQANVEILGPGRVRVTLDSGDLDRLIDGDHVREELHEEISKAQGAGYDQGHEDGEVSGYKNALTDIDSELGEAWEIVRKMVQSAYDDGYTDAIADIEEMGT